MPRHHKLLQYTLTALVLALGVIFVVKAGGPNILKNYVSSGIGTCKTEPILCMTPSETINQPVIDDIYRQELTRVNMPYTSIAVPNGYNVVEEMTKKNFYKKHRRFDKGEIVYILYQKPGFFPGLYPEMRKIGITTNYEFIRRVMFADLGGIKNISDAFFVIMKGIFTPDLGDQTLARMAVLTLGPNRGFINYNVSGKEHFFDCDMLTPSDELFKVYIKDPRGRIDLNKAFCILESVRKSKSAPIQP